jgi:hypothetical protein
MLSKKPFRKEYAMCKILEYSIPSLFCFLFLACATSDRQIEISNIEILDDVRNDLEYFIANKYYDYEKRPVIRVYLNNVKIALEEEPILAQYCYNEIKYHLDKGSQFMVVPSEEGDVDCIVDILILENADNSLTILSSVREPGNDIIVYSRQHGCIASDLISERYLSFKRYYLEEGEGRTDIAYLTVKGINIADGIKNPDEFVLYNRYFSWGAESFVLRDERGYSGYYPGEQRCIINGKGYSMSHETNLFYHGRITSGNIDLLASCKIFFWDDKKQKQRLDDNIQKRFRVNVKNNDTMLIEIFFVSKLNEKKINALVYRKKLIEEHSKIEEKYEVIQVFSD